MVAPIAVCLSILLAGLPLIGCGAPESAGGSEAESSSSFGPKPVTVEVVRLRPEPLTYTVALTGQLEAEYAVVVKSEISGVIRSIELAEGQPIEKDAVLFALKDDEQRARRSEARAEERLARDIFDRTKRLTREDISSIARRAEATAALDEARAKVVLAELAVERTRILAPFDGVVGSLLVGPGELVEHDTPLVSITAIDRLQLLFVIPESSIALARVGAPIHARVAAYPEDRFAGEVFFISPTIDPATRRLLLKAWIPNGDHRLKPGMFANVDVQIFAKPRALLLPEAGMVYDRSGTYVWRVQEDDTAVKVPVQIGVRQAGKVEILGGVAASDRVVSAGIHKVTAGAKIQVAPSSRDPGAAVHAREEGKAAAGTLDAPIETPVETSEPRRPEVRVTGVEG